jgi:MFS family permease
LVSLLGSSLQAGAVNVGMLIAGRFIGGVAVGQLTSTIPMYASELSTPKYRGALSGLLQWFLSWGFLVAQWLGYGCSFNSGQFSCKSKLCEMKIEVLLMVVLFRRAVPSCIPMFARSHFGFRYLVPAGVSSMAHGSGSP